jgi:hypothetical protein
MVGVKSNELTPGCPARLHSTTPVSGVYQANLVVGDELEKQAESEVLAEPLKHERARNKTPTQPARSPG